MSTAGMSSRVVARLLATMIAFVAAATSAAPVTLKIESWRYDDLPVWRDQIIPAFEKVHPGIKVEFTPDAAGRVRHGARCPARCGQGRGPYHLPPLRRFAAPVQEGSAASVEPARRHGELHVHRTHRVDYDDGANTFCVPMASVIHGFIYNADAFAALRIKEPVTLDEFFEALQRIKADRRFIPLVMGTKDGWETATMGYQNIGPNFYRGEEGRKALVSGRERLTDPQWVEPFRTLARWRPYLGEGFEAQTYPDSQNLFTLGLGAIYPAGSWEIADFEKQAAFKLGVFKPPLKSSKDKCYISDHPDIALGANAPVTARGAGEGVPEVGRFTRVRDAVLERLAGLLQPEQHPGDVEEPPCQAIRQLARRVRFDDTPDLSHVVARHPEPRERVLARGCRRDRRRHEP